MLHHPTATRSILIIYSTAVSLNEDVDTDKELVAHGYSNLLAGALGTVYVLKFYPPHISVHIMNSTGQIILFMLTHCCEFGFHIPMNIWIG